MACSCYSFYIVEQVYMEVFFLKRYRTGILFPNFFLTYMLATKLESKKSFVLNIVASPEDVISDANINKATNM